MIADRINSAARRVPPWTLYILGVAWAGWLFWLAATGALSVEPINALEREYGITALKLLVAGLAITPLRRFAGVNLIRFRRQVGLLAFFFVVAHFSVWAILDVHSIDRVWADILKRPYVTIGMVGFLLLIPLAVTSNNASVRRLGAAAWKRLHWLTYPAVLLGAVHYIWLVKGFPTEPLLWLGAILCLLATRIRMPQRRVDANKPTV